jgi:curved DNA-binding protein CbpA
MECNRDDALRAKELSEKKLMAKDLVGSKKFALKAQALFPSLDGISHLISIIDVHLAAESRVCGERDLYAILGVSPSSDDESIKKQYRRLALQLHPDKNRCVGADGAFQYVNEAFNVLSDRVKRLMYDQKRNIKFTKKQKVATTSAGGSGGTNGVYGHTKHAESKARARATQTAAQDPPRPTSRPQSQLSTFWTCCTFCKMQYEYLRIYLNHNLLCPNCKKPFLALEVPHPGSSKAPFPATYTANSGSYMPFPGTEAVHTSSSKVPPGATATSHPGSSTYDRSNASDKFKWGPFDRTAGAASARATAAEAAYAAGKVSQAYGFVKRTREEAQAALKREMEEVIRRRSESTNSIKRSAGNAAENVSVNTGLGGENHTRHPSNKRMRTDERVFFNGFGSSGSSRVPGPHLNPSLFRASLYKLDYKGMLLEKGRCYVQRKQDELKMQDMGKVKKKLKSVDEKEAMQVDDREKRSAPKSDGKEEVKSGKNSENDNRSDLSAQNQPDKLVSMDVPDPEFHDFDGDRVEKIFKPDQIWAIYDDEDGMPRFYAFIQKVISVNPFKVRMAYLSSRSNSEFGDLNWVSHGFAKTCGEFRSGRYETNNTINMFSHQVKWEKGPKGTVTIFPQKGDIWALYRNWSPDWDENTLDETMYKYDMVEILEEYYEEKGISVAPLVKVHGFKAVFRQDLDPANVKQVRREEMFRFSHQVPSYRLTANDAGAKGPELVGCLELDPAATPLELLQVTMPEAAQEAPIIDS